MTRFTVAAALPILMALAMQAGAAAAEPDIIIRTAVSAHAEAGEETPERAAEQFLAHINYARVAIAMKDKALAAEHIAQAQARLSLLKQASLEQQKAVKVESGRVVYAYDVTPKTLYFPVSRAKVKTLAKGPFWARANTLAVQDAEVAYLTLDLKGNKAEKALARAARALEQDYLSDADKQLAKIADKVAKVEEGQPLPLEAARDNLALAGDFLAMDNGTGARFALEHAAEALAKAQESKEKSVLAGEMERLQARVDARKPGLASRAGDGAENFWTRLTHWMH